MGHYGRTPWRIVYQHNIFMAEFIVFVCAAGLAHGMADCNLLLLFIANLLDAQFQVNFRVSCRKHVGSFDG